ncbi:hypothetical protein [Streptomyces drozdowiczii]|uniref:Uncharacterized protein n=1 Tax=Streptomyces drozdowiczii TaxID=202862 RepID=A0ABY6Q1S6_9ACTN|nr:hypothetical protein [Streptomyces drozdowiczii]MCX0247915.1 hypothetical protein [Streptomyces drozdowiczii]MCX0247940.1 hypothetical protein [Streptomyces drozdowiczii]UZK58202.1 hypothetical protein NEH16_32690 [Streptomyces drozdowiczii]
MSSSNLLLNLLLVLVVVQGLGALVYIAYRHPQSHAPLTLALGYAGLLAACVMPIVVR